MIISDEFGSLRGDLQQELRDRGEKESVTEIRSNFEDEDSRRPEGNSQIPVTQTKTARFKI